MVPNSCATHALVSILLNCPNLNLGPSLNRLKQHTLGMNPEKEVSAEIKGCTRSWVSDWASAIYKEYCAYPSIADITELDGELAESVTS